MHVGEHALAPRDLGGDAFLEQFGENLIEAIGGEKIGERTGEHDDMFGLFLDLAHAFEIGDGGGDELDADTEQRRDGDIEQFGQALQRVDLGEFAAFEAIERGARNSDAARNFVGAEARSEAERPQPLSDFIIPERHFRLRLPRQPQLPAAILSRFRQKDETSRRPPFGDHLQRRAEFAERHRHRGSRLQPAGAIEIEHFSRSIAASDRACACDNR